MGRRALRKIDPQLDLAPYLRELDQLPCPLDPAELFGRSAPLEVEIGCGKGLFLLNAARQHPDRHFLGIEVAEKYARFSAARLAKHALRNALMVHGDGQRLMREYLSDGSVSAVHIYFPDPWWKKRHRRRRVLNAALVRNVQRVLVPHGQLHFWTDVREYFESSLQLIAESTSLAGPFEVAEQQPQHDLDYRTHFERRMRLHQEAVYRARFEQSESAGPDAPT